MTRVAEIKEALNNEKMQNAISSKLNGTQNTAEQIVEELITQGLIKTEEVSTNDEGKPIITIGNNVIDVEKEIVYTGTNNDEGPKEPTFTTVANAPDIDGFDKTKTYYVAWNLNTEKTTYVANEKKMSENTAPNNWYDYTEGVNKWANVKTIGGGNDCYWVWIPRYAYKVPTKSNTAQTIEIKFLNQATNIPIGETGAITNTTPTPGTWVVHPAFWWDKDNDGVEDAGEQLTGIWVAKYEASSSNVSVETLTTDLATTGGGNTSNLQVRVIPNVTSWREITVGNIFVVCQNLILAGNSLENTSNIESHMMKNIEWGAVAYLSRSVYGKNAPVWNNPYCNNSSNESPITGLCGNSQDAIQTSLTNTYKYNEDNGENQRGANASTTGNVYGVYDMAGGAWEYVAGILSNNRSNSSYYDFSDAKYTKYIDWYIKYDSTKYGDAVYETSTSSTGENSWDKDRSQFVDTSQPVFARGGCSSRGSTCGIFAFAWDSGRILTRIGFRPCLVSPQQ